MKKIAHRGVYSKKEEENTLKAFVRAIKSDEFVGFECDVRTSRDQIFFIHHNVMLKNHIFNSLSSQELIHKYHLTTLEEVLKLKTKKLILIEIKEPNIDIEKFANLINRYPKNIYIASFDNQVIQKLKGKVHAKLGVLNYVLNSEKNYEKYDFIGLLSPIITKDLITYFKKRNIEVMIYANPKKIKNANEHVYYILDSEKSVS